LHCAVNKHWEERSLLVFDREEAVSKVLCGTTLSPGGYPSHTSFFIIIFSKIYLILGDPSTHPPDSLRYLEMSRVDSLGMTVG
jgi:hypothetical protein